MADRWFFAWGNDKFGPFSTPELRELAAIGRLQPNDTVWKEGVETGVQAGRVKNLFAPSPPAPAVALAPADSDVAGVEEPVSAPAALEPSADEPETTTEPAQENPAASDAATSFLQPEPSRAPEKRKAMAIGASGAIIVSQDGTYVQFRKKCRKCGHEDSVRSTMPIRNGTVRQVFFCPKCKRPSDVEIRGKT